MDHIAELSVLCPIDALLMSHLCYKWEKIKFLAYHDIFLDWKEGTVQLETIRYLNKQIQK